MQKRDSGRDSGKERYWRRTIGEAAEALQPAGGVAEAVGAAKAIQSHLGTEGCLTKADGKAAVSSFGARIAADRTLSRAP